jgi:hypothetical protein
MYPAALALFVLAVRPVRRTWNAMSNGERQAEGQVKSAREQALRLPWWITLLSALGWYPGGVLFPLVIHKLAGPLAPHLAGHFVASFWLSGLIAMAYSLCGVQFVVLRAYYPAMWNDVRRFADTTREELASVPARLWLTQFLAVLIPLMAAVLLLMLGDVANPTFRLLVTGLIFLGIIGLQIAGAVTRGLSQVVVALTGRTA